VQTYDYDSFGNPKTTTQTVTQPYTYTAREYDPETGLYFYRARQYDAKTGRFLQKDPIGFKAGDVNLFRYVKNRPTRLRDPLGLFGDGRAAAQPAAEDAAYWPGNDNVPLGHSDFTGGDYFDYTAEDYGETSPYRSPERHFRGLSASAGDVEKAIAACDKKSFERAMHRGQDYFTHRGKGYDWRPGDTSLPCNGRGHACPRGANADNDPLAWDKAEKWTKPWVNEWIKKCGCKRLSMPRKEIYNKKTWVAIGILCLLTAVAIMSQTVHSTDGKLSLKIVDEKGMQLQDVLFVPLYVKSFGVGFGPDGKGLHIRGKTLITKPFVINSGEDVMSKKIASKGMLFAPFGSNSGLFAYIGSGNNISRCIFVKKGFAPKLFSDSDMYADAPIVLIKSNDDGNQKLIDLLLAPMHDQKILKRAIGGEQIEGDISVFFDERDTALLNSYR